MNPEGSSADTRKRKAESPLTPPPQRSKMSLVPTRDSSEVSLKQRLLSLPDEVIAVIFSKLTTNEDGQVIQQPRHAFALANSHSRLLRAFSSILTKATTDKYCFRSRENILLTPDSLLQISEVGPLNLRVLHLDMIYCGIFEDLPALCPDLQVLSVSKPHTCSRCANTISRFLDLNLRSFTIRNPSSRILASMNTLPEELNLLRVDISQCSEELKRILESVTKKLQLELVVNSASDMAILVGMMPHLSILCSRGEELSVNLSYGEYAGELPRTLTEETAIRFIRSSRSNNEASICRSIKLSGHLLFGLLRCVHPAASVELSSRDATFIKTADGVFATKLPLLCEHLGVDLSRVQEVVIDARCHMPWKNVLSGKRFSRGEIRDVTRASIIDLKLETVFIELQFIEKNGWDWLSGARELHLLPTTDQLTNLTAVLEGLPGMLDKFDGSLLWVHDFTFYDDYVIFTPTGQRLYHPDRVIPERVAAHEKLMRDWNESLEAVERFEQRGGNGERIRAFLEHIRAALSQVSTLATLVQVIDHRG